MQLGRIGRSRPRAIAGLAVAAVALSLFVVAQPAARADKPPNPSDSQLHHARQSRNAIAGQVANLGVKVANLQQQLFQLQAAEEQAEQKYAYALQKLHQATDKAKQTKQDAANAAARVAAAQQEFVSYAQAAYMSGSVEGMTGTLLTASDPNALLQESALQGYQASHQVGAIDDLQRATVAKSNADAAARLAVQNQQHATDTAEQAKQAAVTAYQSAQSRKAALQQQIDAAQNQLEQARSKVAILNGQRATYNQWHQRQLKIIAERKRQARLARIAAAKAAQQAAQNNNNGGSSSSGGGGGGYTGPPQGGSWTPAKGVTAAKRALNQQGIMYAWAGGNRYGPTYGVCAGDGAFNDCNVLGFDCSGLVMYAWGPWMYLDHYAATQYNQAGSYHPSPGNFMPGDLLFWSSNGTVGGIHHVAIYVGNGNVVQAPQSGSVITVTPWQNVSWGYYGATRPLT